MNESNRLEITLASAGTLSMNTLDRATLAANTDMVRLLFGVPGTCWGSFLCSHARISGRMYAITTSVLFYSNVLGFERRLCLNFADIIDISFHRTTSLRFELANDEVYIFRSFQDREQVLGLLTGLRRLSGKEPMDPDNPLISPQPRGRTETSRTVLLDADQQPLQAGEYESPQRFQGANSSTSFSQRPRSPPDHASDPLVHPHSAPVHMNRKRAVSDSVVRLLGFGDDKSNATEEKNDRSLLISIHEERRLAFNHTMSAPLLHTEEADPTMAWETEKAKALSYENTGVEDVRLECTLDQYFDLFLSDGATCSFTHFQKDVIADKDVTITDWKIVDEGARSTNKEYTRTLSFTHPIRSSIGPSEAHTERQQVLKRFSSHGMILMNSTRVSGIPAADCFRAEDFWIIEAEGNETILVSARFAPRFHRRTMLKSIIERSIKRETTEWFRLYFDMVRTALEEGSRSPPDQHVDHQQKDENERDTLLATLAAIQRIYKILLFAVVLLFFILFAAMLQAIHTFEMAKLMKAQGLEDFCAVV